MYTSSILGNPYQAILYTDCQPLVLIIKKCELNSSKHARWCNLFRQLQIEIIYQSGKEDIIVNALSRIRKKENNVVNTIIKEVNNNNYNFLVVIWIIL